MQKDYVDTSKVDISALINKKIEGMPKDIQARMDGLDEFIELMLSTGAIKNIDGCIDYFIARQMPKDEKDKRFFVCVHKNQGGQTYQKEKAVYDYLKSVIDGFDDVEKLQVMQELMTMFENEQSNIPSTILKYLVLKMHDEIEFASKNGRSYLHLNGFEIASMVDEEQESPNCQDFSFVTVLKELRGLGLGNILLHNYLKFKYLQNENNEQFTIRAYGVASDNIVAQSLYSKFGAEYLDENENIISQKQYKKAGKHLYMQFSNNTLKSVAQKQIRPFMSFADYSEKHFNAKLEDKNEKSF